MEYIHIEMINKDFENWLQLINKLIAELSTRIVLPFEGKDLILITHSHNSKTTYAYPISESYDVNIKLPSKIYKEETNSKQGKSVKSKNFDSTILCTNYVIREVDVVLQGINVNYFIPDSDLINNDVSIWYSELFS